MQVSVISVVLRLMQPNRWSAWILVPTVLAMTACAQVVPSAKPENRPRPNPNALWHIVHDSCAPAARRDEFPPNPCAEVSAPAGHFERGYVVLMDMHGRYQYLVLPVARITGIGSPILLKSNAPNYLGDAWTAHLYVDAALHKILPRYDLSLAVNSKYGRSQNQLHVHVVCIRPDVHETLHRMLPDITGQWKTLPAPLHGHVYLAKWVNGVSLSINPFRSLAVSLPAGSRMEQYGLAVVGAYSPSGDPGFILLATRADVTKGNYGSSEELQDRSCAIAYQTSP